MIFGLRIAFTIHKVQKIQEIGPETGEFFTGFVIGCVTEKAFLRSVPHSKQLPAAVDLRK